MLLEELYAYVCGIADELIFAFNRRDWGLIGEVIERFDRKLGEGEPLSEEFAWAAKTRSSPETQDERTS